MKLLNFKQIAILALYSNFQKISANYNHHICAQSDRVKKISKIFYDHGITNCHIDAVIEDFETPFELVKLVIDDKQSEDDSYSYDYSHFYDDPKDRLPATPEKSGPDTKSNHPKILLNKFEESSPNVPRIRWALGGQIS